MTVLVDDNHFSPKSSASKHLAQALREKNNDAVARLTIKHFRKYTEGLSEILKLDNPVRNEVLALWYGHHLEKAKRLKPTFDKLELPFHDYENLLIYRLRQARSQGALLQRMRG
jgi:hypothetical protein